MKYFTVIFLTIVGLLTGCKKLEKATATTDTISLENVVSLNTHKVVVIDKIPAGGYIYLKVSEKGKKYWVAVPGRQIEIGASYYYDGGMEMKNFESKTLKRIFDRVIFASGVRDNKFENKVVKKIISDKGNSTVVNIEKASNGIRVAELFENPQKYQSKLVIIKGQVVKVNNGIMGVNFIHLQDGTKGNGEFDITITTDAVLKVGAVVTIEGMVVLNKDFGSGYTYDVLIEKAIVL